ncbi:IclR family transcriptional regulator [Clostridium sp. CF012]|uniref:IclR family transcriptional regulator n=1 Tax=Clostridium sp. CF012 TaxID=2843319 RepID=UPI001C0D3975|nr:IclR family transcriptional regulator [Clostridium sp. CF012]MBU3142909.1 IclR family transcriptional regulator [Clostridium sp. CF012]
MFRRNKSAYRAIEIVSLIANNKKSMTIAQVSRELDIPGSSAFELLYTLVETGVLIVDSEELKTFKLGIRSFEIGSKYLEGINFNNVTIKYLEKLSATTGETVFMDVEDKGHVIHINKVEGTNTFRSTCNVGHRNYMHCSSVGKALLATYSDETVKEIVDRYGLTKKTKFTITEFNDLIEDIKITRHRGYAIDDREDVIDGLCIGAPIYDHLNKAIAAISVSCQYSKMTKPKIEEFAAYTYSTALDISKQIGFKEDKLYYNF